MQLSEFCSQGALLVGQSQGFAPQLPTELDILIFVMKCHSSSLSLHCVAVVFVNYVQGYIQVEHSTEQAGLGMDPVSALSFPLDFSNVKSIMCRFQWLTLDCR